MSSEANYSLTTKVNGDLFTVRGDSAEEFTAHIASAINNNLVAAINRLQDATSGNTVSLEAFPTAKPVIVSGEVPFPEPPAAGTNPRCIHGERNYREGVSKAGKPYKGWFCIEKDFDQQCKPQYGLS